MLQSQPSQMSVDPLDNNDVIHEFANAFHDVQTLGVDEDDSEDDESSPRNRRWLAEEEVALTKAYLHCSESKKHSNRQKYSALWRRVKQHFLQLPGSTNRKKDKLIGKWGDLNKKMSKFNACFVQEVKYLFYNLVFYFILFVLNIFFLNVL